MELQSLKNSMKGHIQPNHQANDENYFSTLQIKALGLLNRI